MRGRDEACAASAHAGRSNDSSPFSASFRVRPRPITYYFSQIPLFNLTTIILCDILLKEAEPET